jgi:hypothetical protein
MVCISHFFCGDFFGNFAKSFLRKTLESRGLTVLLHSLQSITTTMALIEG